MKKVIDHAIKSVKNFYTLGEGLKSVDLKNYTSGDGQNPGFEALVKEIIYSIIEDIGIDKSRVEVHNRYFQSDYSVKPRNDPKDPQRMDIHVKIDNLHPLIIECRAWIDKPFYTLKRSVTRNFMELPYVRKQLTDDVQFVYLGLAIDVMDRAVKCMDISQGYGDRVNMFKFSPKRRSSEWNYFDNGVHEQGIKDFISFVYKHLKKYK